MAANEVVDPKTLEGIEVITQASPGMYVAWADIDALNEQDVNPQIMEPTMFGQLVQNVSKRSMLESVPYCAVPVGKEEVELVSGHKRTRAAREAGVKRVIILLDVSGLTRSEVAAKVLAHNNIHGYSDLQVMKELAQEISEIEDRLEAYLPPELDEFEPEPMESLLSPKIAFDWKTMTLAFLSHQLADFRELIDAMPGTQDLVAAVDLENFDGFATALSKFSRFREVKSANQAVAMLTRTALDIVETGQAQLSDGEWVHLSEVIGNARVPHELAESLLELTQAQIRDGAVPEDQPWRVLENLIAHYEATDVKS